MGSDIVRLTYFFICANSLPTFNLTNPSDDPIHRLIPSKHSERMFDVVSFNSFRSTGVTFLVIRLIRYNPLPYSLLFHFY